MKAVLKVLGGVVLLIGVGILLIPTITETPDNKYLFIGLCTIIFGFLLHILLNKVID